MHIKKKIKCNSSIKNKANKVSTYNIFTSLLSLPHNYLVLILLLLLYFFHFLMVTLHRNGHALESIIALSLTLIKTGRKLDCIL